MSNIGLFITITLVLIWIVGVFSIIMSFFLDKKELSDTRYSMPIIKNFDDENYDDNIILLNDTNIPPGDHYE